MTTTPSTEKKRNTSLFILIVEDDEALRYEYKFFLERHYFRVEEATDGQSALDLLLHWFHQSQQLPLVILTDLEMPVMNGLELISRLKTDPGTPKNLREIPLIICSGASHWTSHAHAQVAFCFDKPVNLQALLTAIHSLTKD